MFITAIILLCHVYVGHFTVICTEQSVQGDTISDLLLRVEALNILVSKQTEDIAELKSTLLILEENVMKQQDEKIGLQGKNERLGAEIARLRQEVRMMNKTCGASNHQAGVNAMRSIQRVEYSTKEGYPVNSGSKLPVTPAFTARAMVREQNIKLNDIIMFETVITNLGDNFSVNDSTFTAPTSGIYYFTCSTMSKIDTQTAITVNGTFDVARMYTGTHNDDFNQGVNAVIVQLDKGDKVWVRKTSDDESYLFGYGWTTFTGFLIAYWS